MGYETEVLVAPDLAPVIILPDFDPARKAGKEKGCRPARIRLAYLRKKECSFFARTAAKR